MPKVVSTYDTTVDVHIPDCDRAPHFAALATVFSGKKRGSKAHKDACYALCRVQRVSVKMDILSDGTKKIRLA